MSYPIVLILGAGSNIGQGVARAFASKGYKVALASRSIDEAASTDIQLHVRTDLSNPDEVVTTFEKVKNAFGFPSVVIYNASSVTFTPPHKPFAIPLASFNRDMSINVTSAFVAAQQATTGFAKLSASTAKAFIYTGNITNVAILPKFLDQGMGKSAGPHMMWAASVAYKDAGYKFYYADERKADGSAKYRVDADAHGQLYLDLAEGATQGPWLQTFVKDVGYTDFQHKYGS